MSDTVQAPEVLWRVGQHYGIHVYAGERPVATFHDADDARSAVEAHNAAAVRSARPEEGIDKLRASNRDLHRRAQKAEGKVARSGLAWYARAYRAERRQRCEARDRATAAEASADALATKLAEAEATIAKMREVLRRWCRADHIRLHAGEMTAQEMRSVKAVVGAIQREIDSLATPEPGRAARALSGPQ